MPSREKSTAWANSRVRWHWRRSVNCPALSTGCGTPTIPSSQEIQGLPGVTPRHLPDPNGVAGVSLGLLVDDPANTAQFVKALRAEGIPARHVYGGKPVYNIEALQNYRPAVGALTQDYTPGLCPRTEAIMARAVNIAIAPSYTDADCADVVTQGLWKVATQVLA